MAVTRIWDANNGVWQELGMPRGGSTLLGYAVATPLIAGITNTWQNLGVDVTYDVPAGRLIRYSAQAMFYGNGVASLRRFNIYHDNAGANPGHEGYFTATSWSVAHTESILVPTAGTHTASYRAMADSGSAGLIDCYTRWLTIEDITPNASPLIPQPANAYPVVQSLDYGGIVPTTTATNSPPNVIITIPVTSYLLLHWGCQAGQTGVTAGQYFTMSPQIDGLFVPANTDDEAALVHGWCRGLHQRRAKPLAWPLPTRHLHSQEYVSGDYDRMVYHPSLDDRGREARLMFSFLKSRSVVEVMTLTFTGLIAFIVVLGAALVAVAELLDPTVDTSQIVDGLTGIITGILGALLGLLAGKADAVNIQPTQPPREKEKE